MQVYIAADGDSIGKLVGQARLNDNVEQIRRVSQAIEKGNQIFESFALANGGSVIESGGDELLIEVDATALKELESVRNQYFSATNATISVGIGKKPSEASKALLAAKFRGKNRSVFYDDDVEKDIKAAKLTTQDEKDKIVKEYLIKSLPLIKRANDSGGRAMPEAAQNNVIAQNTAQIPAAPVTQETVQEGVQNGAIPIQGQGIPIESQQPLVQTQTPQYSFKDFENQFRNHADQHESATKAAKIKQSDNYKQIKAKVAESLENIKEQLPNIAQLRNNSPDAYEAIIKLIQSLILMGRELDDTDKKLSKAEEFIKGLPSPTGFVPEGPIQDTLGVSDDSFGKQELVTGGKADGKDPKDFDPEQLAIGTQHELEHTKDVNMAQKIAMDHMVENPNYYKKLQKSEEDERTTIARELQYDGQNYQKGLDQRHNFTHQQDGSRWLYLETTKQESIAAESAYNVAAAIKEVDAPYHILSYNMIGRHGIMERNIEGVSLVDIKPQTLTSQEKLDLTIEMLIDWLVGNATISGSDLIRTVDGHIVSMAKKDAFKDFSGIGPYYQNYIDCIKNGSIMFDLNLLEPYFGIIDSINDEEYLENIGQYAQAMWPEDLEAQLNFAKLVLLRKRNARYLFVSLFKQELNKAERPEFGKMRAHINPPVGAVIFGKILVRHWDGSKSWKSIKSGAILGLDPGLVGEGHAVSAKNPGAK